MGRYITPEAVKIRTQGKIPYADDDLDDQKVGPTFLADVIEEAESEVEMRLSVRYAVPFQTDAGLEFSNLPTTTKTLIQTLCRMETVRRLLDYDFGRGTAVEGEQYAIALLRDYERRMDRIVSIKKGTYNRFQYPPLTDLRLAPHNDAADDGYEGEIYVTSDELGGFAPGQMPAPGQTYWNGRIIDQ